MVTIQLTAKKEDIDFNNHVNYSVYLKWFKKGHDSFLKTKNLSYEELRTKYNLHFFVRKIEVDYLHQVFEGEEVVINTEVDRIGNTSITYHQNITKNNTIVCEAHVVIVFVNLKGEPTNIPEEIRTKLV